MTQAITFLLNFGSVMVVSRLLTPEEIGIFSVAVSLLGFAHILRDFGVGNYLIQAREITREKLRAAFSVMLYSSWSIAALLYLVRTPIADFYGREGVAEVIGLIAFNFLIIPFGAPILSVLRREMQFGKIAIVSISNTAVQVAVTIACALNGLGYISMAWGSIAGMLTNVVVLLILRPRESMLMPTFKGLRQVLDFGYKSSTTSFVAEFGSAAPDLILGRTLGFAAVAYYSRAAGLIQMAMGQMMKIVQDVFLPAFASQIRSGGNPADLYIRATSHTLAITVPTIAFLTIMAEPLILFLFGDQWIRSAPLASFLCIYALLQSPFALASNSLIAGGHIATIMRIQIIIQSIRVMVLMTSIWLPLETVVPLLVIPAVVTAALCARALRSHFNLRFRVLWRGIRLCFLIALLSALGPIALRIADTTLGWQLPLPIMLFTAGTIFAGTWLIALHRSDHPLKAELHTVLAAARSRIRR
ncbi:MAG: hypothetical protein C0607_06520 [Azoarcus sp.]|nr:MAG: hypothetical protein C0607_06520 [Azoarcus sp.]